jgi:hypothetical protein
VDDAGMRTTQRLTAACGALAATFAIVWSIAALAYPQETQPATELAARTAADTANSLRLPDKFLGDGFIASLSPPSKPSRTAVPSRRCASASACTPGTR